MRTANDGAHYAQVTQYTFMMIHRISEKIKKSLINNYNNRRGRRRRRKR